MKKILTNRTGVTILEGLIALGLLALVAAGTFGVLLSVSHKSTMPDLREEMVLAVEKANDLLQMYADQRGVGTSALSADVQQGLCGNDSTPMKTGEPPHYINCLLPVICDSSNSEFSYTVATESDFAIKPDNNSNGQQSYVVAGNYDGGLDSPVVKKNNITFNITCNGFTL